MTNILNGISAAIFLQMTEPHECFKIQDQIPFQTWSVHLILSAAFKVGLGVCWVKKCI